MLDLSYMYALEQRYASTTDEDERLHISHLLAKEYKLVNQSTELNFVYMPSKFNIEDIANECDFIITVIESCENGKQLQSARNMIDNFSEKYRCESGGFKRNHHGLDVRTALAAMNARVDKVCHLKNILL